MFSLSPRRVHSALVTPLLLPFLLLFDADKTDCPVNATDASYSVHGILHGSFPFNDPIFIVSWGAVSHGTLTVAAHFNGFSQEFFVYEPSSGFTGNDSFTYQACDSLGNCVNGTISLSVVNNAPHAVADSYTLHGSLQHGGDFPVTINDFDEDHDPIRVTSVTEASQGTFTYDFLHDSFTYEPRAGFAGTDNVSYTICDNLGLCDSTTITLIVVNHPPVANRDDFTIQTNETLFANGPGVLKNDSDPDNDPFSVTGYTQSPHGHVLSLLNDGSLIYEPNQGFVGQDSFNYTVCDYLGGCANGLVMIDIQGDAPTPTPTPVATPAPSPSLPPPPPSPTPTPTPLEPLIFIPGISGSYLVDQTTGKELWPGIGTNHNSLSLDPADSPNPNIMPTDAIRAVLGKPYYGLLLDGLASQGGFREYQVSGIPERRTTAGCDLSQKTDNPSTTPTLFVFAYDWRKSNDANADALNDYVGCIRRFHPDGKLNILTHSLGSLVARRFILKNPGQVKKLITIAGPWLGAPKGIYTLETGDANFSKLLVWNRTLKKLTEYFKSVHELIPALSYFDIGQRPFAEQGDINGNAVPDEVYSYNQLTDLLDRQFPATMPGSANRVFHLVPGQDDWRSDKSGIEYHHILGVQHINQTIGRVVGEPMAVCRVIGHELACFDRTTFEPQVTHGDGTVPEESATRIGTSNLNAPNARLWYYFSLNDDADEVVEHTGLTRLAEVRDRVLFILGKGPDPGDSDTIAGLRISTRSDSRTKLVHATTELSPALLRINHRYSRANHAWLPRPRPKAAQSFEGMRSPGAAFEPAKADAYYVKVTGVDFVAVTDDLGNSNTRIDDTFALSVPNLSYDVIGDKAIFLSAPADKIYTINFQTANEPISVEILRGLDNSSPTQAFRYRDLLLLPNTNVRLSFGPNGIEDLRYDADGDGLFESSTTPTAALTGPAAADVTPPSIVITGEPQQNTVRATISAQDSESGVRVVYYSTDQTHFKRYTEPFQVDPSEIRSIFSFADDKAGNRSATAIYDLPRPPSITAPSDVTINTEPGDTNCGVTVAPATLGNAVAVSNSSGNVTIRSAGVPPNNLFPVGVTQVTYTATDSNGLIATATQTVTVIDTTPPAIDCPDNFSITLPANSTATSMAVKYPLPMASDNCSLSDLHALPPAGTLFPLGTSQVVATATDVNGNVAARAFSVSVLYRFAGFFRPIDNLPTMNSANAGRAIPVKFSLSGNKGLNIFAAAPASGVTGCDATTELELAVTVNAGTSALSYDSSADQYVYVWKTERSWASTCRQLVVQLNDGTIHRANFKFK